MLIQKYSELIYFFRNNIFVKWKFSPYQNIDFQGDNFDLIISSKRCSFVALYRLELTKLITLIQVIVNYKKNLSCLQKQLHDLIDDSKQKYFLRLT